MLEHVVVESLRHDRDNLREAYRHASAERDRFRAALERIAGEGLEGAAAAAVARSALEG
ncbi:MAG: hypothetical protein R6T85_09890 [Egibacteraceae bacterium]